MVIARLGILMEFHIFMNVIKETYIGISCNMHYNICFTLDIVELLNE